MHLARLLSEQGDEVRSIIRKPEQADEIRAAGAEPAVCDLESASEAELAEAVGEVDAVVFAAGAGPGSGPERKRTMDHGGAVKLIAAAKLCGIERYVMVSSIGADPDATGDETFAEYLRAKGRADADLVASGLAYTIVRPVSLTDAPGAGTVTLGEHVDRGEISREDVAAVLAVVLHEAALSGRTIEATGGETPVQEAVRALGGGA
jgi:uncharacterized protein YbjT (DUF2867 family)